MRKFVAVLLLATALPLSAGDDPHSKGFSTQCLSCHVTHKAAGMSLTSAASNENLCGSCHNAAGTAAAFPLEGMSAADLNARTGSSHAWNVIASAAHAGALAPADGEMNRRLDAGKVICSTCHEQHGSLPGAIAAGTAGTQHRSSVVKLSGAGTGTLSFTASSTASARSYLIEIVESGGAPGSARFRLSNDGGLTWFGYSGAWVAYSAGNAALTAASVQLNDGTKLTASFSGNFSIGDRFRFYVGYPFLRVALDSGNNATGTKFCRDCHREMAMDHAGVRTYDGQQKSHPVGIVLGANGEGYDRAVPLDGNGAPQGGAGADANASNDLRLATDSTVQCLSCHGVHHADGNTSSVDAP